MKRKPQGKKTKAEIEALFLHIWFVTCGSDWVK